MVRARPGDAIDAADAEAALTRLPAVVREVVLLRIWSQLGWEQIGELTGVATSTAYERYRQGLRQLKELMEPSCKPTNT